MTLKYRHRETKAEVQSATPTMDSKHIHVVHADGTASTMTPAEFAQTHEVVPPAPQAPAPDKSLDALHDKVDRILKVLPPVHPENEETESTEGQPPSA